MQAQEASAVSHPGSGSVHWYQPGPPCPMYAPFPACWERSGVTIYMAGGAPLMFTFEQRSCIASEVSWTDPPKIHAGGSSSPQPCAHISERPLLLSSVSRVLGQCLESEQRSAKSLCCSPERSVAWTCPVFRGPSISVLCESAPVQTGMSV